MTERAPLLWLDGAAALELAPRLEASGYRTTSPPLLLEAEGSEQEAPDAAILSPSRADRISDLRLRWGALPILLGSARDDVEGRVQALSHGADDLWLTSAGPSDLLTRLRLHLNRQPPPPSTEEPPLVVGDLEVDPRRHTVTRAGRPLALTSREHQLLTLLLRHAPRVVSRERILREIWPEERGATSNVIEVYVRYLRRKLEEGGQSRLIHTVRGEGYCLRHTATLPT
ncbi:MAG: winged-helix domain-containing protein [Cyanobacteriota bacterium]